MKPLRPLVLLHGFTGGPESWDGVVARLTNEKYIARGALLGHAPDLLEGARDFEGEVDRLAVPIRALGEGEGGVHLVGYSLGARLALGLLVRHPPLVARATLIGVNPGLATEEARSARLRDDERWASLLEREGIDAFADAWEAQPLFASQARLPPEVRDLERARRRSHSPAGLALALRTLGLGAMPDYTPLIPSIAVPVTLVAGEDDEKFRALALAMSRALPRSRLRLAAGAGHNVLLERPDAVAAALTEEAP